MAISVTEILGTDSLSGSRLVINDNFNVLASEINSMEVYFAPSAGTITNLNNVSTEALRVGLSTILLDISGGTFDILSDVRCTGNIKLDTSGLFRDDTAIATQNDVLAGAGMNLPIGTSTAIPNSTMYRVGNGTAGTLTLQLYNGSIGQEVIFAYSEAASTGTVAITAVSNNMVLTGAGTMVNLSAIGETVHLLSIDNGSGVGVWYVVGGTGFTVS